MNPANPLSARSSETHSPAQQAPSEGHQAPRDPGHQSRTPERDLKREADKFSRALAEHELEEGERKGDAHHKGAPETSPPLPPGPASTPGDSILRGLHGGFSHVEEEPPASRQRDLGDIISQAADRLLVSAEPAGGAAEVRLHLKSDLLPETEVRITREHGELRVQFVTTSAESAHWLTGQQAGMQDLLGRRLAQESVRVTVQQSAEGEATRDTVHHQRETSSSPETSAGGERPPVQ